MHEPWPPDYLGEYRRRITLFDEMRADSRVRGACLLHYKSNPIDFIGDVGVTYDPRVEDPMPRVMPFMLFERQREFIRFLHECLQEKQHGLVEKSRDVGASYLSCAFTVWLWLFHPDSMIGWGSRKEEYVDKRGDPKAIFPKIRQMLEYVPEFMMPAGFDFEKHATYMKILNPENSSVISGEAGRGQGRGSRSTIYFLDEFAHCEGQDEIEAALGDNTDCAIAISSVNGTNNLFYRKRMAGEVWHPDAPPIRGKTRVFIFDWRDSPLKNQEWYDIRKKRAEAEGLAHIFAQEVDRNYQGSIQRVVIPHEWVLASIDCHKILNFQNSIEKIGGVDCAQSGGDKNALIIRHGSIVRYVECTGGDTADFAKMIIPTCIEYGVKTIVYDSIGIGAAFKAETNHMKETPSFPRNLLISPWNAGAKPLDPDDNIIAGDSQSPTNEEMYGNLKAQSWFRLRTRFHKTYRAIKHGEKYPDHEMISLDSNISRLHELCNELSQAQYKTGENGKTIIEKAPDGASSPNMADAAVMAFNPAISLSIFDVL